MRRGHGESRSQLGHKNERATSPMARLLRLSRRPWSFRHTATRHRETAQRPPATASAQSVLDDKGRVYPCVPYEPNCAFPSARTPLQPWPGRRPRVLGQGGPRTASRNSYHMLDRSQAPCRQKRGHASAGVNQQVAARSSS